MDASSTMSRTGSPRKGGPKEARMKARGLALDLYPAPTYTVRFSNLPKWITKERLRADMSRFGETLSSAVPTNMQTKEKKGYGFVEFKYEEDANSVIEALNGNDYHDHVIGVCMAVQESIFSQNTGYITNEHLDFHVEEETEFDSSMPESHYEVKHKNRPLDVASLVTVKVDNLPLNSTSEQLREIFSQFGEVGSCRRPVNFAKKQYHPFCFVKFLSASCAQAAVDAMNESWLADPVTREEQQIFVSIVKQISYYGQDESTEYTDPKKLAKKKLSHR
jgi:RNA recognition motif-containing protein